MFINVKRTSFDVVINSHHNLQAMLEHINSCVRFKFQGVVTPQFSSNSFAELLNMKTGKIERFSANTFKQYFKSVSPECCALCGTSLVQSGYCFTCDVVLLPAEIKFNSID